MIGKKATKKNVFDKGQNSCYDVDFSGYKLIYYFSYIILFYKKVVTYLFRSLRPFQRRLSWLVSLSWLDWDLIAI